MPLTPLHLAAGLPLHRRISITAFILINVLIDVEPATVMFFQMDSLGYPLHQWFHTLQGVTCLVGIVIFPGLFTSKRKRWCYGALFGGYSHLLLDALVHWDVQPFYPLIPGNPLYLDLYHGVSALCVAVLAYYLAKWVESLGIGDVGPRLLRKTRSRFFPGSFGE